MLMTGLDRIALGLVPELRGLRVGVLCNHTAIDRQGRHIVSVLREAGAVVVRSLAPEHGLWATHQDMEPVVLDGVPRDPLLDVPVVSLYGHDATTLTPAPQALAGLDALVFDIRDIGARYYTYAATLAFAMRAVEPLGLPVWVCDRPNPIGPSREGPLLRPGFESFCGIVAGLPIRHGLSIGALGRWYQQAFGLATDLRIIPMMEAGPAARAPIWVWPSPNMPTVETAVVYPGLCLLEGTTLSEGRGTTTPFLQWGAPGLDTRRVIADLTGRNLPGVTFLQTRFRPAFGKHAGRICDGVFLHLADADAVHAVNLGAHILDACRRASPDVWAWRTDAYEFVTDVPAIDLLWGSTRLREAIDAGRGLAETLAEGDAEAAAFRFDAET